MTIRIACALSLGVALSVSAAAQNALKFAAPTLVHAGDKKLGEGRLYPSPMFHDVNADGQLDLVVGDLRGHMTVALGKRTNGLVTYGDESKLKDAEGKDLDFGNW